MRRWYLLAVLLAASFTGSAIPRAQAQLQDAAALAAADSAAADSLAADDDFGPMPGVTGPYGPPTRMQVPTTRPTLSPKVETTVKSSVASIEVRATLEGNLAGLAGRQGQTRYTRTQTDYRQLDRDQESSDLSAGVVERFGSLARLSMDFRRNTNFDENRVPTGSVILESENVNARMLLEGGNTFTDGFRHRWAARGVFEDVQQSSRGVENNRSLAGAAFTSVWNHKRQDLDVTARYGYDRSTGRREVRGLDDDAKAERDTVQARARIDFVPRVSLDLRAGRTSFTEQRLDFARNFSGVVDTASTTGPKVARERESTNGYDFEINARSQVLPRLRVNGQAGTDYYETEFVFSRQGFINRGTDRWKADATFRYAEAGSLQVNYAFSNRYNDRRTQNDTAFRGLESARSYSADIGLKQKIFTESSLELVAKQTLDQSIFEERGNNNDRDRLFERFDAVVKSRVIPYTSVDIGGTTSRSVDLQIAADRAGDNKEERLVEARGSYVFNPPGGLRLSQSYRLQIRFIDFFTSDNRDQFNKQGQVNTKVDYDLPMGSTIGADYVLDYRRTGTRDTSEPLREIYIRDQRRFDHRLTARMGIPLRSFKLDVRAERGFLREERGTRETEENRGQLSTRLSGNRRFWQRRANLRLNVERVLQFGPRIRDEQRDYWVADSTLTVTF